MPARGHKPSTVTCSDADVAADGRRRPAGASMASPSGRRPVLLVADDEAPVRRLLERLAHKIGYEVLTCDSGTEAIRVAGDRRPNVVLVDLRMPGADGLSVLKAVRSDVPKAAVIIMTAYAAVDSAVEAMRLGAREYLPKPLDLGALRSTLADLSSEIAASGMGDSPRLSAAGTEPEPTADQASESAARAETSSPRRPRHLLLVRRTDRPRVKRVTSTATVLRVVSKRARRGRRD